jgi:G-patch domain
MAYVEELSGSKLKSKLGSTLNEAVAMGPNRFAQSQLERMGWSSGEGLGKNRQGIQTHVRIQTRDEQVGLGHVLASSTNDNHGWWNDSMGEIFSKLQQTSTKTGKTKKKKKKTKTKTKEKLIMSTSFSSNPITDEDLFRATGGKRFGMRAQRKQIGKWARTESNLSIQEEEEVKKKLEWNGRGQATVVLPSNQQSTTTTESSTFINDKNSQNN